MIEELKVKLNNHINQRANVQQYLTVLAGKIEELQEIIKFMEEKEAQQVCDVQPEQP